MAEYRMAASRTGRALRKVAFGILRWSLIPWLVRCVLQRGTVTILLYHDPAPEHFAKHVEALRRRYAIIPLKSYIEARASGNALSRDPASVVLTLDDGHKGNYRLLQTVRDLRVPVTVFLTVGLADTSKHFWFLECQPRDKSRLKRVSDDERLRALRGWGFTDDREYAERQALSAEEIESMKGLFDVQAHTMTHPILPACSATKARQEICRSKEELVRRFGLSVLAFAYPNGDYSMRDLELVRECGYACALTLDHGYNTAMTDMFKLRRILVDDDDGINALLVKASGIWGGIKRLCVWKGSGQCEVYARTVDPLVQ